MPYIMAPRPTDPALPVFFNVETSVGNRGANSNRDDILLVQFLLKALTLRMTTAAGQRIKPILAQTPQTGVVDQATIRSIEAFQDAMKTAVDGRVSPAQGYRYSGGGIWTIANLQGTLREDFRQQWPRLDQIPGCPPGVKQMMTRLL